MSETNLYLDVKTAIEGNFDFLSDYGFDRFSEEQIAYEYHFVTSNRHIKIDIWFELIISTPIWIKIDNFSIGSIEPENPIFQELARQYASVDDRLFEDFSNEENYEKYLEIATERYQLVGRAANDRYLAEAANILRRHDRILTGDLSTLEVNSARQQIAVDRQDAQRKISERIYTCYFDCCFGECYYESSSIDEIEVYLSHQQDVGIENIQIYDWEDRIVTRGK